MDSPLNLPLERQLASIMARNPDGSYSTQDKRSDTLMSVARFLHEKYGLQKWDNLKLKHVTAVIEKWKSEDAGRRSIDQKLSHMRWLVRHIGKANLMPKTNRELGVEPGPRHTRAGKTISDQTFNKWLADLKDERIQAMLHLGRELGLRFEEAALFRPNRDWDGTRIWVKRGTKGGQPRYLFPYNPRQIQAIERAMALVTGDRGLIPLEARTFKSWAESVYAELRKVGIGRETDMTFHDLRRTYACERMAYLITVKGMSVQSAAGLVSRELGHHRTEILRWYWDAAAA